MDVVRTKITKLKGIVEIVSEYGKGTIITLKLPLTLAIIQGLLMKVADETFAVPLNTYSKLSGSAPMKSTPFRAEKLCGYEIPFYRLPECPTS